MAENLVVDEQEVQYDNISVTYSGGYINEEHTYVVNHSNIEEIIFRENLRTKKNKNFS
ncbi:DUF4176 domain-containing protein [Bacillus sp. E(2018)]|uniref:DUF4176 domain-containing protein n=1 Tax=Bacillus sp. E(2018) TaxID=2502239 RepID=UPI002570DCF0|nr:DUF4176 domain-containing protein [Bacillus sp. E(2018)]